LKKPWKAVVGPEKARDEKQSKTRETHFVSELFRAKGFGKANHFAAFVLYERKARGFSSKKGAKMKGAFFERFIGAKNRGNCYV